MDGRGLGLLACDHVKPHHAMILVVGVFSGGIALALLRHHMHQNRTVLEFFGIFQDLDQIVHVVAVDWANIVKAQFFEKRAARDHAAGKFFGLAGGFLQGLWQGPGHGLAQLAQGLIAAARDKPGHIGAHAADRGRNRHVIVIEDDNQLFGGLRGIIHGLIGHARAHRAVADHGNDLVVLAALVARGAKPKRCRDRGGGMGRPKRIVWAFRPLGKARQAAALAQGVHPVAATGQDLVRIGLMANIPDQYVLGRLKHMVQGHRQLDHAKARAKMAACTRYGLNGLGANLVGQLSQLGQIKGPRICGQVDRIQKGRF